MFLREPAGWGLAEGSRGRLCLRAGLRRVGAVGREHGGRLWERGGGNLWEERGWAGPGVGVWVKGDWGGLWCSGLGWGDISEGRGNGGGGGWQMNRDGHGQGPKETKSSRRRRSRSWQRRGLGPRKGAGSPGSRGQGGGPGDHTHSCLRCSPGPRTCPAGPGTQPGGLFTRTRLHTCLLSPLGRCALVLSTWGDPQAPAAGTPAQRHLRSACIPGAPGCSDTPRGAAEGQCPGRGPEPLPPPPACVIWDK